MEGAVISIVIICLSYSILRHLRIDGLNKLIIELNATEETEKMRILHYVKKNIANFEYRLSFKNKHDNKVLKNIVSEELNFYVNVKEELENNMLSYENKNRLERTIALQLIKDPLINFI